MTRVRQLAHGKLIPLAFLSVGVFILMQVILPVVSFQLWELGQQVNNQDLISPKKSSQRVLGVSVQNKDNFPIFISHLSRDTVPNYSQFQLSVPKLGIDKEMVYVDSNDLLKGLAQLPGSALPGERGNLFISGHSAASRFFSNQVVVFARLADLKKGDEISVDAGNTKFVYKVSEIKVVDPGDLSVISAPDEQGRYISLMTCVPPGLNYKRLVVLGKMI